MSNLTRESLQFGVIVLAAGASRRMGRPKMLLPWRGTSVIGHLVRQWTALGSAQLAVVCAVDGSAVIGELDRLGIPESQRIHNPQAAEGMFSSIRMAATWNGWDEAIEGFVVVLGDQPHLPEISLRRFLEFVRDNPMDVCQPAHRGRARHPVYLPRELLNKVAGTNAAHLKEFLNSQAGRHKVCEMNEPAFDLDLDLPEDYEKAVELYERNFN